MLLTEQQISIPLARRIGLFDHIATHVRTVLSHGECPVRWTVSRDHPDHWDCDIGLMVPSAQDRGTHSNQIFRYHQRTHENTSKFNAVMVVPTGVGASIGGHAGDATPVARMLAASCDTLVLHPNVVNASDINEMPSNALYVEGSVLCRLLMGTIGLRRVRSNRVLVVMDERGDATMAATVNAVSAARATLGLDCDRVIQMRDPIHMTAAYTDTGRAAGRVEGVERLFDVLDDCAGEYDAIALATKIDVPRDLQESYFRGDVAVNPWGGVEAILSHAVSLRYNMPVAHGPMSETDFDTGVVEPKMAAEAVSVAFLHCVLKGLHDAPAIVLDTDVAEFSATDVVSAADIACLVVPYGCLGLPTLAALSQGIRVIAVCENRSLMHNDLTSLEGRLTTVSSYPEAAGVMAAMRAGVSVPTILGASGTSISPTRVTKAGTTMTKDEKD